MSRARLLSSRKRKWSALNSLSLATLTGRPHRSSTRSARAPTNYLIDIQPIRDGQVSFAGASRALLRRICTLPFRPSDPRIVRDERKTNRIILGQKRFNKIFVPGENQPRNLVRVEKSVIKIWSSNAVDIWAEWFIIMLLYIDWCCVEVIVVFKHTGGVS